MLDDPLVKPFLTNVVEDESNLPIIECLIDGVETDEEIAEKTGIRLNLVRKILYKLYDLKLASYKRSKDPETQWFTYSWKFEKDEVVRFISKVIFPKLELGWFDHMMDNKTELQEVLQQNGECKIKYNEVNVTGPDNERVYTMNVVVNNEVMGEGTGRTKKAAEQMAAYQALKKLRK